MTNRGERDRPVLSLSVLAENGDVIIRSYKTGRVQLTVRNVADTETTAAVELTYAQAQAIGNALCNAEAPEDDDD